MPFTSLILKRSSWRRLTPRRAAVRSLPRQAFGWSLTRWQGRGPSGRASTRAGALLGRPPALRGAATAGCCRSSACPPRPSVAYGRSAATVRAAAGRLPLPPGQSLDLPVRGFGRKARRWRRAAGPPSMRRAVRSMVCKAVLQARERRGRRCFWRAWRAQAATTASMTALWTAPSTAARAGTRPALGPPPVPSPTAASWSIGTASARRCWAAARPWSWRGAPLVPSGPPLRRVPSGASLSSMNSTWPRWLLRLAGRFREWNRPWTSPKAALRVGFCSVSLLSETGQRSKPSLGAYCCRREFVVILYHGDCFEVDGQ
mmetsp:Transcript_42094/g.113087  ORF Transcript_42094/g.113087 Transcript_42094/m.113087 type:complete len:316 (+) Transcript_42094:516-1463(+)